MRPRYFPRNRANGVSRLACNDAIMRFSVVSRGTVRSAKKIGRGSAERAGKAASDTELPQEQLTQRAPEAVRDRLRRGVEADINPSAEARLAPFTRKAEIEVKKP